VNYRNGAAILSNLEGAEWSTTTLGAVAVFGEGGNGSLNEYGRLYNGYAVDDARGLCPSGFSGLPGGVRAPYGTYFGNAGHGGVWWSSSLNVFEDGQECFSARSDRMAHDQNYGNYADDDVLTGNSVRCIQDSEQQPGVFLSLKFRGGL